MPVSSKKNYDPAFREESVRLVLGSDRLVNQVASETGVKPSTLGNWVRRYSLSNPGRPTPPKPEASSQKPGALGRTRESTGRECEAEGRGQVPGKSQRLLCREAEVEDFYEYIEAEKANHSIDWLCRALKVSRASFYRWRRPAGPTTRAIRPEQLTEAVTTLFSKEKQCAGRDQLTLMLNAAGTKVSAPTVGAEHAGQWPACGAYGGLEGRNRAGSAGQDLPHREPHAR
ncbi:transposase [Arthrobacter rhombi]|uniref:transposase n=1 Tax=Arthrobacter rhombi TaxID=71253 RepID=UPI000B34EC9B